MSEEKKKEGVALGALKGSFGLGLFIGMGVLGLWLAGLRLVMRRHFEPPARWRRYMGVAWESKIYCEFRG